MPRIDTRHWLVAQGEDWKQIAAATGNTREQLWEAIDGRPVYRDLRVGEILHLPFVAG
jgi:hypothetical protein